MLEPLSKTKRSVLLVFFCMLFIVLIPVIFFRSAGFRFGTDGEVVPTGGLYFNLDDRELEVYINGVKEKSKGLLSSGLFVSPLEPKQYSIEVKKEGYSTWLKNIEVFPQKVAEASPFVVPLNASTTEVMPRILDEDTGRQIANPAFVLVEELFEEAASSTAATASALKNSTATGTASTSLRVKNGLVENGRTELFIEGKNVVALWTGSANATPSYFCDSEDVTLCNSEIVIPSVDKIMQVDFYPERRDVIIVADAKKIYITELDRRSPINSPVLFEGMGAEFRLSGSGELFVKRSNKYYTIPL